jgi:uncharacterized spore protein YtfJ
MTNPSEFLHGVGDKTAEMLGKFFGSESTSSVFTQHTDDAGNTIITAAAFERAGVFGWGGGSGTAAGGDQGGGGGAGGGGVAEGRPVAVIRVGDHGVEVTPVIDLTKVAVTFLVSAAAVWRALR